MSLRPQSSTTSSTWIKHDEEGEWFEEMKEQDYWRIRPIGSEEPTAWATRKLNPSTFYDQLPARAEPKPLPKQQQPLSEDEWERPAPRKQKIPTHGKSPQPKKQQKKGTDKLSTTPLKQTELTEFFSPASPFSPSSRQTLNGLPRRITRQANITKFLLTPMPQANPSLNII